MFRNPFSFKGRISRTEYALSILLSLIGFFLIIGISSDYKHGYLVNLFVIITYLLFNLTQGTKRCHDINQSGLIQFIPFSVFILVFQKGVNGRNKYGEDPKSNNIQNSKIDVIKQNNNNFLNLTQEVLPYILFNIILIISCLKFIKVSIPLLNFSIFISVIISYFLFLLLSKKNLNSFYIQFVYSFILFILIRLYSIIFLLYAFDFFTFFIELSLVIVSLGLTSVSTSIHKFLVKKRENE